MAVWKGTGIDMQKKVIYFLCEYFSPDNEIGAIRITKLVKYFCRMNYQVHVFTCDRKNKISDSILVKDLEDIIRSGGIIHRVSCKTNLLFDKFMGLSGLLAGYHLKLIESQWYRGRQYVHKCKKIIKENAISKPDIIISSYGDMAGHFFGLDLKKRYKNQTVWIADFRDPIRNVFVPDNKICKALSTRFIYPIIKEADKLVVVLTKITTDFMDCPYYDESKVTYIPNGYDEDDFNITDNGEESPFFDIVYTGTIYKTEYDYPEDMSIFFQALLELIDSKRIDKKDIRILYAGKNFDIFREQIGTAEKGLEVQNFGFISRSNVLELQRKASILLYCAVSSEKTQTTGGKIFEYIASKRPVIAIINGNVSNGIEAERINHSGCGYCYELFHNHVQIDDLKNHIAELYNKWKNKEELVTNYNYEFVKSLCYESIADRYEKLCI